MIFDQEYSKYLNIFNGYLKDMVDSFDPSAPKIITEAMTYAVDGGGKRIRPVLCLSAADMLGVDLESVKYFALAIELIHSYSLVHDDLPAMDNDDYRRGKLSTHKKFGEAYGILAGDALLNFAFETCLKKTEFSQNDVSAMRIISEYAGYSGMIAGQVLDIANENNQELDQSILYDIYYNKTAKLLTAPLLVSSVISGGKYFDELKEVGINLGIMFQITDDIMDEEGTLALIGKTPHKDKESGKFTSIKIFGIDGAKEKAKECYDKCMELLYHIPNSDFLSLLTNNMYNRKK